MCTIALLLTVELLSAFKLHLCKHDDELELTFADPPIRDVPWQLFTAPKFHFGDPLLCFNIDPRQRRSSEFLTLA